MSTREIRLSVAPAGGKRVTARYADGTMVVTDQPVADGGEGAAPTPFQLFWASLATCAVYYAMGFCEKRDIDTTGLSVDVICSVHPERYHVTEVTYEVTLPEDFPDKYAKAVLRAMDQCFVKKHVFEPPTFSLRVAEASGGQA